MFGLKAFLIGGVAALVIGFGAGVKVRDAFCDAAEQKAKVRLLERQISARTAAEDSEAALVPEQKKDLTELEDRTNDLRSKISPGECFSANDVDWLRNNVWGTQK